MRGLPKRPVQRLKAVARKFGGQRLDTNPWRRRTNNQIWMRFVSQVVVVGNLAQERRMNASPAARQALAFGRLRRLSRSKRAREVLRVLSPSPRGIGALYFRRKTKAIVRNHEFFCGVQGGPKAYLARLVRDHVGAERPSQIARDLSWISLKGSRDISIEFGIARDVVAFDVRILKMLRLAGVKVPKNVQSNPKRYKELETALVQQVCRPAGISGAQFDRLLFTNYTKVCAMLERQR